MALKELFGDGNGEIIETRQGMTCHREFICDYDEGIELPLVGQPHPVDPRLVVEKVVKRPEGPPVGIWLGTGRTEKLRLLVDYAYSNQRVKLGDPPRVTFETITECLALAEGRYWAGTGDPIDESQSAIDFTLIRICYDLAMITFDINYMRGFVNKVNDDTWQGAAAGCVLFEGFSAQAELDWDTGQWYQRVQLTFLSRERSHNLIWKAIIPARDHDGRVLYYQGDDPLAPNYTSDVWKVGHPVPKDGLAGLAGWEETIPPLYESADFASMITGLV